MLKTVVAGAVGVTVLPLTVVVLAAAASPSPALTASSDNLGGPPSTLAQQDIPPDFLAWYQATAQTCPGLPWSVLAGIGKVESDHGRSNLPGVHSGANSAGAEGPMQFLPATFARYAVNADPAHPLTPYDPADAIYTAARMLCADGARGGSMTGIRRALFAYNHADWYVTEVLAWAARYAAPPARGTVAAAIAFAQDQIGKPYCWGGEGPGCYDCSGLVVAAYTAAGIHLARTTYQWRQDGAQMPLSQIQPGDLLFSAGSDGTRQPRPRRHVPRPRPGHPGPADRRERPDRPPRPGQRRRRHPPRHPGQTRMTADPPSPFPVRKGENVT